MPLRKAQTPLLRSVVDLLYNKLHNSTHTTNPQHLDTPTLSHSRVVIE